VNALVSDNWGEEDDQALSLSFLVPAGLWGQRLDKYLAECLPEHSRARLQGWIEAGHVKVNEKTVLRARHPVSVGDTVQVVPQPSQASLAYAPENMVVPVFAQSEQWLVIDKPVGLVVHPGAGNWSGTLLNGLLFHFPELAQVARAGIVHRLDKDTSGLMVVARTPIAQTDLVRQLQARTVKRQYLALIHGHLKVRQSVVDQPIGRDVRTPIKMSVQRPIAPREAVTHYVQIARGLYQGEPVSAVKCQLQTGRTHQIRVHMASLGHPLLGDVLYGGRCLGDVTRQMLHARELGFDDPVSAEFVHFCSDAPKDMQGVIQAIDWEEGAKFS
jgi:23S rRNA pseudouridine1911/1915/1917 synthase